MFNAIAKPFGVLLLWLNNLVGSYGIAIFLFALVVKIILLPFQMKSKKSMMRMSALQPQVAELQKRHEGNPQKLQQETARLYKEEHINPMSGCLWSLIPFPILIALYQAIRYPMTVMMGVSKELLAEGGALLAKLTEMGFSSTANAAYLELEQSQFISKHFADFAGISDKLVNINYSFLGLDLGNMPKLRFWLNGLTWASIGLFLIPVVSALFSWLQIKISSKTMPSAAPANEQAQKQGNMMNLIMPLTSLYIGFIMPAALGIYWIYNSVLALVQEVILNKIYGKQIAAESAEREARMKAREAEWERRRQETERLRAEGKSRENTNTSKKKQQARQKAELDELRAAAIREERAARRAAMGLPPEEEIPASQVGNRRYARGRAYVPDRFTNPEGAEAATAAAAAESEGYVPPETEAEASEDMEVLTPDTADVPEEPMEAEADEPAEEDADEADYDDDPDDLIEAPDEE